LQIPLKEGIGGERQGDFTDNSATLHVFEKMKSSSRASSTFQEEISIYILEFSLKSCPVGRESHLLFDALFCFLLLSARSSNKGPNFENSV
jgi:hypothetical protein